MSANSGDPTNQEVKDLLLEEYRAVTEALANSEQSGETRVNWLIGIVTGAIGGLIALCGAERRVRSELVCGLVIASLFALLIFGLITLFRIMKRNAVTDGLKQDVAAIRQAIKDHFDHELLLLYYQPFGQQYGPRLTEVPDPTVPAPAGVRKFGGLAHMVAAINGLLFAGLVGAAGCLVVLVAAPQLIAVRWVPPAIAVAAAAALAWSFRRQHALVEDYERKSRDQMREGRPTHAGGVVCRFRNGVAEWLVVGTKTSKQSGSNERLLPKGHITRSEGHAEAALREVREETGIVAQLVCLVDRVAFEAKGEEVDAKFYLMEWLYDTAPLQDEDRLIEWHSLEAAIASVNHVESKHLLREAARKLSEKRNAKSRVA